MSFTLSFNYAKAYSQARELDNIASALENLTTDDIPKIKSDINKNWVSSNATLYNKKVTDLGTDISTSATQLRGVATAIRQIADNWKAAEEAAAAAAQDRVVV